MKAVERACPSVETTVPMMAHPMESYWVDGWDAKWAAKTESTRVDDWVASMESLTVALSMSLKAVMRAAC